ncbi:hypothetical protein Plhal304r1_c006g0025701 [Plasmopara halstedii]
MPNNQSPSTRIACCLDRRFARIGGRKGSRRRNKRFQINYFRDQNVIGSAEVVASILLAGRNAWLADLSPALW